jgi:hypothetical protein
MPRRWRQTPEQRDDLRVRAPPPTRGCRGAADRSALDVAPAASSTAARDAVFVVAWNAERCKFLDESAAFLAAQGADVLLLSELDWGMARSGQHHCARELASRWAARTRTASSS